MCGIAGIISKNNPFDLQVAASQMAKSLELRGPDHSQVEIINNIALVHTRLAIQDLSPNGEQPMTSHSTRYIIAFNGEIYNFLQLRKVLEESAINFKGGSDTEVMLAAFELYGIEKALSLFEGMFAFVLIDQQEQKIHLCRDRLGEKPLYFAWQNNTFAWGSELKALKTLPTWNGNINQAIIPKYLQYGYVPTPWTMYENCFKLEPGTLLSFPLNEVWNEQEFSPHSEDKQAKYKPVKYWDLSRFTFNPKIIEPFNYSQAVNQLDNILCDVILDQMISDVPIGAFLSGGIDSSLVASIMQDLSNKPINTFTIGFNEKDYNEAEFAAQIAKHIGSNHHQLYISSDDCLDQVSQIKHYFDEPFADSSALPAYFVSKMARDKVTVCLSGDGGDELYCGYNRYVKTEKIWHKVNRLPLSIRKIVGSLLLLFPPSLYEKVYSLISLFLKNSNANTRVGLKVQKLAELLKKQNIGEIYEMLISYCQPNTEIAMQHNNNQTLFSQQSVCSSDESFINKAMAIDTLTYLPDDNLTKVDRTSMASSLETRLPLLNHRVLEFAWTLPIEAKFKHNTTKRILRDVLFKRVPKNLIERPKMGFSVPISSWLRGPLQSWANNLLENAKTMEHGYLNSKAVSNLWQEHQQGVKDNSAALWSILMFQDWYHQ